jgi:UDP-N-acetyl-D-mannosaminuronic acid dehydrogenase
MEKICVLGLGYIGLPTASMFATNGYSVCGVDVNRTVVDTINKGEVHIEEAGLRALVKTATSSGNFHASPIPAKAHVYIIAVPTPINEDKQPDLTAVFAAVQSIIPHLRPGNLIILESTSPPGTTMRIAERVAKRRPELSQRTSHGWESHQVDFAYCPERVLPGRILKELVENDRVVGGLTERATQRAAKLYESVVDGRVLRTDCTTAEMVKLVENTFRDVNIALANEFAVLCERVNINVWDVISLANRHPRVKVLNPGPGVGGHCIGVDPWFIVSQFPRDSGLIRAARLRNEFMPKYVAERAIELVSDLKKPKIALLGVAYKANVDDARESPAIKVFKILSKIRRIRSSLRIFDPLVKNSGVKVSSLEETLRGADLILILTDHDAIRGLRPRQVAKKVRRKVILDTRNCLERARWLDAGFQVHSTGVGDGARLLGQSNKKHR